MATERFWRNFGMHVVSASPDRLTARGLGAAPCIAVAERAVVSRFVGPAYRMSDDTDLKRYADRFDATWLSERQIPGRGRCVELFDPSGCSVWRVQGQQRVKPLPMRPPLTLTNTAQQFHGAKFHAIQPDGAVSPFAPQP